MIILNRVRRLTVAFLLGFACVQTYAQQLELVYPPPVTGTFYFASRTNVPPFWFDPFSGQLPIYRIDGHKYLIDDSQVDYSARLSQSETMSLNGGETMLSGPPSPCEGCPPGDTNSYPKYLGGWTTNSGVKFAPTPAKQGNIFSTWLQDADTNSAYEIYETFQLATNTVWNRIVAGQLGQTNFAWSLTASNNAIYSAADAVDSDFDGLSDAFEERISHTLPLNGDSDNDGIPDGDEDFNGNGIPDSADYSRISRAVIFSSRATAFEGGIDGEVTVLLPFAAPTNGTTITLHLGGTAEFNSDYQLFTLSGQPVTNDLVFAAGDIQKKLLIRAVNDSEQAPRARSVSIALVASTNYFLDPRRADVALIENDLPSVSIIANDRTAAELAVVPATNTGIFILRREGSNGAPLTVRFNTNGSTASSGIDYTSLGTSIVIPAGSNEVRFTVTPLFDSEFEGTESVVLNLESDPAYVVSAGSATVQILDDDLPTVSFIGTDTVATEYNSLKAGSITVRRTGCI